MTERKKLTPEQVTGTEQRRRDAMLERRIERAYMALQSAATPKARRHYMDYLERLIASRSQAQIERMERERGLR